jgi:hypothetical protein
MNTSLNVLRINELLEHMNKYLFKSLPFFVVLNQNLKQLETLLPKISQVIETLFKENKQLLKKLLTCNKSSKTKYFKRITNKILLILQLESTEQKLDLNNSKISYKHNIYYLIPTIYLLNLFRTYIFNLKDINYLLIRITLEADIFNGFPNFQRSMLIRKYMEAYLLNKMEFIMHEETSNLREIMITHKKIFIEDAKKSLDETNFIILIQTMKTLIKVINNLAKLFRTVDDHLTLIPTKEANAHNYFKRNISENFKLSNFFFKLNKISYARDKTKVAV